MSARFDAELRHSAINPSLNEEQGESSTGDENLTPQQIVDTLFPMPTETTDEILSYTEITNLNDKDKENIESLISILAKSWKVSIFTIHAKTLLSIGKKIAHIHPVGFLSYIIKNSDLKFFTLKINKDSVKKSLFFPSFVKKMNSFSTLDYLLVDFCEDLKKDLKDLKPYFESKEWEKLFLFLLQN